MALYLYSYYLAVFSHIIINVHLRSYILYNFIFELSQIQFEIIFIIFNWYLLYYSYIKMISKLIFIVKQTYKYYALS